MTYRAFVIARNEAIQRKTCKSYLSCNPVITGLQERFFNNTKYYLYI
jgi:hypothetical protein